jgi:hypothetical protein
MPLQKIKFQTNITVEATLKFAEGKLCDSQFGDPQYMFTTIDDHVFFVAEKVAQKIHGLRLQPQEPFEICKKEVDYGNGRKGIEWQVAKVGLAPGDSLVSFTMQTYAHVLPEVQERIATKMDEILKPKPIATTVATKPILQRAV